MAGGRRPANFAAGTRQHQDGAGGTAGGAVTALSYDYSIWQTQSHQVSSSPPPARRPALPVSATPLGGGASGALAVALDAAVAAAVRKALGGEDDWARSEASEGEVMEMRMAMERLGGVVAEMEERMAEERQGEVRRVEGEREMMREIGERVGRAEEVGRKSEERARRADERVGKLAEGLRKAEEGAKALRDGLDKERRAVADLRAQRRKAESDGERLRVRVAALESAVDGLGDIANGLPERLAEVERKIVVLGGGAGVGGKKLERIVKATEAVEKKSSDAVDAVSALRSRLKRVESSVDTLGRKDEALSTEQALQNGAIGQLRDVNKDYAASVKGLKKLVETNLRSHASSEGVVQSQAQLITRHVCVALRQFIARRITENNALIDKTLRARCANYAKGDEQFVLVRETNGIGEGDDPNESSSVLPGSALEALASASAAT